MSTSDTGFGPAPSSATSRALPWTLFVLALIAAIAGGVLGWERNASTTAALSDATKRAKDAEDAKAALEQQLADRDSKIGELSQKSDLLQQNLDSTQAELEKLKATTDTLEDKLKAEIAKGDIRVEQNGDRITVDLIDRVLFDSGDAELSARGKEVLGRVAAVLQTVEDKQIQVSGHTDDIPIKNEELKKQFPSNWELSSARAVNVVRYLTETGGVKPERMTAAGYGQFHPIASNATPKGRAKNRRIEILLTPALDAKKAATPKTATAAATPAPKPTASKQP